LERNLKQTNKKRNYHSADKKHILCEQDGGHEINKVTHFTVVQLEEEDIG
jgi:hypothetical protein